LDEERGMSNVNTKKGTIAILTGGGDVPGLNPAIRALTVRALREGYRVLGIRRGWAGLVEVEREKDKLQSDQIIELSEEIVNKVGRTGGTFLHTSRTRPSHVPKSAVPLHLRDKHMADLNDLTPEVLANIGWLGIDTLSQSVATTRSPTVCACTRRE
jgi:6-phosphofructokinase